MITKEVDIDLFNELQHNNRLIADINTKKANVLLVSLCTGVYVRYADLSMYLKAKSVDDYSEGKVVFEFETKFFDG